MAKKNVLIEKLNAAFGGIWTDMAGTEQTHAYEVICGTSVARLGIRNLGGSLRIRVEPVNGTELPNLTREAGWKQPGDSCQVRYSKVVETGHEFDAMVAALAGIGAVNTETVFGKNSRAVLRTALKSNGQKPRANLGNESLVKLLLGELA